MKVYIVTCGKYSDYHIYGVYPTYETAEEVVKTLTRIKYDDCFYIEEYEVGKRLTEDDFLMYVSYYSNDNTMFAEKDKIFYSIKPKEEFDNLNFEVGEEFPGVFNFFIPYKERYTDDILLKIARDRYAQYKAEKENII